MYVSDILFQTHKISTRGVHQCTCQTYVVRHTGWVHVVSSLAAVRHTGVRQACTRKRGIGAAFFPCVRSESFRMLVVRVRAVNACAGAVFGTVRAWRKRNCAGREEVRGRRSELGARRAET